MLARSLTYVRVLFHLFLLRSRSVYNHTLIRYIPNICIAFPPLLLPPHPIPELCMKIEHNFFLLLCSCEICDPLAVINKWTMLLSLSLSQLHIRSLPKPPCQLPYFVSSSNLKKKKKKKKKKNRMQVLFHC